MSQATGVGKIDVPVSPKLSIDNKPVHIDKKRLEHLMNIEKEYMNIIAYGVKHAIEKEAGPNKSNK
jgi:hypothetical protein